MLHIVQSNRLDSLATAMLDRWSGGVDAHGLPLSQLVIVPSRGIERWLSYRIADRFGVCANVNFQFTAAFIWRAFSRALTAVSESSPFDSDVTTLRLFSMLGSPPKGAAYEPLRSYLASADDKQRLELARRIAQLFAQYMVYRPDWLEHWATGRLQGLEPRITEQWQQGLWKELLASLGSVNVRHPKGEFFEVLVRRGAEGLLPSRLRIFGLPDIPPLYAEILNGLARYIDVEWYNLNPCRQFWADVRKEKALIRQGIEASPNTGEVEQPLLASWGRQRRDQLGVLAGFIGEENSEDHECFAEPRIATLLGRLQSSILEFEKPDEHSMAPKDGDRSIQVHSCHSLTRQVEVLHDQLLALFEAHPDLKASDVAVFTPDIDSAAPIVDAVFGSAPQARRIPYTVTGRDRPDGTPFLQAANFVLNLPASRFEVAQVLAFLEIPAVLRRYGLDATELETIQRWLREAGARWGLDAGQRERLGLPAEMRHTWADALHRLLLGYAMPTDSSELVQGILPYGDLEGSEARILGTLGRLLGDLARASDELGAKHRVGAWPGVITRHINACIQATPDDIRDQERLRAAIADLGSDVARAETKDEVGIEVIRALLEARLGSSAPGAVPSGRVTFTGIGPLRGIPYRVICLIGLEAEAFPRNPARLEFDLRQGQPRAGDRSRRDDDRGAFLDALTCAQDVLYLSYTGRSIRDNAALPPSVLIAELLDYLGRFEAEGRAGIDARLVTKHPLQPFNRSYFEGGTMFSYDAELLPAAEGLSTPFASRLQRREIFDSEPLPAPAEDARRIELDEVTWFLRNPTARLMRNLGIRLPKSEEQIEGEEPFELDMFSVKDTLLELRLGGRTIDECIELIAADRHVPHGQWGRQQLGSLAADVDKFAAKVEAARGSPVLPPHPFELQLGDFTLWGALSGFNEEGLFGYSMRAEGAHDLLGWWLRHLVLCATRPPGAALRTKVLLAKGGFRFGAVANPQQYLQQIVGQYGSGLQRPLPLFPKSSLAYSKEGIDAAMKAWKGGFEKEGERANRWYKLVLGGEAENLPEGFESCAELILGPLLAARADLDTGVPAA